ncbi:MAG: hypothetical protein IKQ97_02060 [Eubacterium sp.]|nr:hypothetical protein [Eubacterium sp.]
MTSFNLTDLVAMVAAIAAILTLMGYIHRLMKWFDHDREQDAAMKAVKDEQRVLCVALAACLDGLEQLGANHSVTRAKKELINHIQTQAHK